MKSLPWAITDMFRMFAGLSMRDRIYMSVSILAASHNGPAGFAKLYLLDREAIGRLKLAMSSPSPICQTQDRLRIGKGTYLTILAVFYADGGRICNVLTRIIPTRNISLSQERGLARPGICVT